MAKTVTLGLMSGTSLDGVDAVAVDFSGVGPRLIGHHHIEFPKPLKEKLLALCQPGDNEIDRMGVASVELGKFYVHCVNELLDVADIGRKDVAASAFTGRRFVTAPNRAGRFSSTTRRSSPNSRALTSSATSAAATLPPAVRALRLCPLFTVRSSWAKSPLGRQHRRHCQRHVPASSPRLRQDHRL